MIKALKLSPGAGIFKTKDGLTYSNCYESYFDKCNTKQAQTNNIIQEMDRFNSYFNRSKEK